MLVLLRWRWTVFVALAYGFSPAGSRSESRAPGTLARSEIGDGGLPKGLAEELAKHSAMSGQRDRAVDFDGAKLLVYILSKDDTEGQHRWDRLKKRYDQHFRVAPDDWDRLWFRPVTQEAFVDHVDLHGRYTLKPAYRESFVPGVERVLMIPEVSHYLSFVAFLFDFVQTGAEKALFLEDDFNFIPIVDNHVYNGSLVPWSDIASNVDKAADVHEYSPSEFRSRISTSVQRWAAAGDDMLYLGSLFETTTTSLEDLRDKQLLRVPRCAMGSHGMMVTRTAAQKLLTGLVPIWTRTDAAIYLVANLRRSEAVPGIVGQNKYWEVYKSISYSSLNDVASWQSRYKAIILKSCTDLGVCTADLVSVEWYAAVWGRTIACFALMFAVYPWLHDRLNKWIWGLLPKSPKQEKMFGK